MTQRQVNAIAQLALMEVYSGGFLVREFRENCEIEGTFHMLAKKTFACSDRTITSSVM